MVDNLLQFLVILSLGAMVCGMPAEFVLTRVFPRGGRFTPGWKSLYSGWPAACPKKPAGSPPCLWNQHGRLTTFVLFVIGPT